MHDGKIRQHCYALNRILGVSAGGSRRLRMIDQLFNEANHAVLVARKDFRHFRPPNLGRHERRRIPAAARSKGRASVLDNIDATPLEALAKEMRERPGRMTTQV